MLPNAPTEPQDRAAPVGLWLYGTDADVPPQRDRLADQAARAGLFEKLKSRGVAPVPGPGLSHSGGFAAYGNSTPGNRIGVDLEWIRERDVLSLAEFAYSAQEHAWLKTLKDSEQQSAFVELWVLKEAAGKALGLDLFDALRNCRFELNGNLIKAHLPRGEECTCSIYLPRKMLRAAWVSVHARHDPPIVPPPSMTEITVAKYEKPADHPPARSSHPSHQRCRSKSSGAPVRQKPRTPKSSRIHR